jgi:outer membrane lipoprotein-sorting protein
MSAPSPEQERLVQRWLDAQTNVKTWSADFVQTRTLKALTQPLVSTGRVWFAAPNQFRWELGDPAQTIALRLSEQMLVIYPLLKRVEKYPMNSGAKGPWRDALALLEAGFPRDRQELDRQFRITSATPSETNQSLELTLQPRTSGARRMMPQIKIAFSTNDWMLVATELHFADGSVLRNDFTNAKRNFSIDEKMFQPDLGPEYRWIEPLAATAKPRRK